MTSTNDVHVVLDGEAEKIEDPTTTKFFYDRHDARVAAGREK